MEFFPNISHKNETEQFVNRMKNQFTEMAFCYFAVDKLENREFIGFIGIAEQNFESDFTPFINIGWRLAQKEWGKGYATEGAKRCIDFAFNELGVKMIKSICPIINKNLNVLWRKLERKKRHSAIHYIKNIKTLKGSCFTKNKILN